MLYKFIYIVSKIIYIRKIAILKCIYSSLMYFILTAFFNPPSLPTTSLLPQIHSSFVFLQKRAGLLGTSAEHSLTSYSKTGTDPHIKAG